tara:strand:+ start:138 stop:491 length:354 start_codon:yes stop_codon:yes gene_type:complete
MPGKIYEDIISQSTDASGSAIFYSKDYKNFTLYMAAQGGTNPRATYSVSVYPTADTPDSAAVTYKNQSVAGAVQVFENIADSNGQFYGFYKIKISYADLTNDENAGAGFGAAIVGCY